ncbi:MAG: hypothetical protein Tsb0021_02900 [Chlamydiales bacterium]
MIRSLLLALLLLASPFLIANEYSAVYWQYSSDLKLEKMIEFADTEFSRTTLYRYGKNRCIQELEKADGVILHHTYDHQERLKTFFASDNSFHYTYHYDEDDQITSTEDGIPPEIKNMCVVSSHYEDGGNRCITLLPDKSKIIKEYSNQKLMRVIRINQQDEELYRQEYLWDSLGALYETILPFQLGSISYQWDANGRLLKQHSPYWTETLQSEDYDADGNICQVHIRDAVSPQTYQFAYDEEKRLIHESNGYFAHNYRYDTMNNIIASHEGIWEVDALNQTRSKGSAAYAYDANGNLRSITKDDDILTLRYDGLDRLTEVTSSKNQMIRYTYDAENRRISKSLFSYHPQTQEYIKEKTVYFLYDGNCEIGMLNEEGTIIELRVLGQGNGAEIGAGVAFEINNKVFVPIYDHRGNVVTLIDSDKQEVSETIRYTAFGDFTIHGSQGRIKNHSLSPWLFSSKRYDPETGLFFYGKRYYCPEICKWITPDPLGFGDNANRYVFLKNNPINSIDLFGLFSFPALWNTITTTAKGWYDAFLDTFNQTQSTEAFDASVKDFFRYFMGEGFFSISDYQNETRKVGVFEGDSSNEKIKVTFINGILNSGSDVESIVEKISAAHDNQPVHYIYRGTQGWPGDILTATLIKFGIITQDAYELAAMWKQLIAELGGVGADGTIIHYAHSIGATETLRARNLLSPEEQQMIKIISLGPATIIPNEGFQSVINYVSRRDGVCYLDPLSYLFALIQHPEHIIFLGAHTDGYPFVDHLFQVYWHYLRDILNES